MLVASSRRRPRIQTVLPQYGRRSPQSLSLALDSASAIGWGQTAVAVGHLRWETLSHTLVADSEPEQGEGFWVARQLNPTR